MFGDCVLVIIIDDSIGQGSEEEGVFYGEEEEGNFNLISIQGKLILANPILHAILTNYTCKLTLANITNTYDQASYTCKITPLTQSQFLLQA